MKGMAVNSGRRQDQEREDEESQQRVHQKDMQKRPNSADEIS